MITGFLHPGSMGASLAAWCTGRRLWVGRDRSAATRGRARDAGMSEVASIGELASQADIIVSVCPPAVALEQADAVAATGYAGLYVDVNAVAPATARAIGGRFERFVDGGVIGPPVREPGSTRLYLAGSEARTVAALWEGSPLDVRDLDAAPGAASAVKACYAAWTKGSAALLLAVRGLASAEGVEAALLDEWALSIPDLVARSEAVASGNGPKAWRFVGEMEEIAAALATQGLPDGFATASADVYRRLSGFKDTSAPSIERVIEALLHADPPPSPD